MIKHACALITLLLVVPCQGEVENWDYDEDEGLQPELLQLQLLQTQLRLFQAAEAAPVHSLAERFSMWLGFDLAEHEGIGAAREFHVAQANTTAAASNKGPKNKVATQTSLVMLGCIMLLAPPIVGVLLTLSGATARGGKSSLHATMMAWFGNARFVCDAELALRGGFFAVVAALPFVVPDLDYLWKEKYFDYSVLLMYVFTLYKSVGETMNFAFAGVIGTMLAVFNIWVLYGFFPDVTMGKADGTGNVVAVVDGVLFALAIIVAHVDNNLRMFALSNHVYFIMSFLDPKGGTGFHADAGFKFSMEGEAARTVVLSGIGAGTAVLVTLVPFPIFALDKARDSAEELSQTILSCWSEAVSLYTAEAPNGILQDTLKRDVDKLKQEMLALDLHLTNSWWECLGLGRPQKARFMLKELSHSLRELYNRLCTVIGSVMDEDFSDAHCKLMASMQPHLSKVCSEASSLMELTVEAALDGVLDPDEAQAVAEQQTRTNAAIVELTKEFQSQVTEPQEGLADEYAFCLAMCAYGRISVNFADAFEKPRKPEQWAPKFMDSLAQVSTAVHWNCALRFSVALGLSFLVGYTGIGASVLPPYSSGCAVTVSLLFNTRLGTPMRKNLGRLQGVVLGQVLGQAAYVTFAWCSIGGHLTVAAILFVWEVITLFAYYNSVDFGYIACLMAGFVPKNLLQGCSDDATHLNAGSSYSGVVASVVGILVMTLVDMSLTRKKISEAACERLDIAWSAYSESLATLFDPSVPNIRFHSGHIFHLFAFVKELGELADSEPRFWRTPWRHDLFQAVVATGFEVLQTLCSMESAFAEDGCDGSAKSEVLRQLVAMPAFQKVEGELLEYVNHFKGLFHVFKHTTEDDFFKSQIGKGYSLGGHRKILEQDITKLCLEMQARHIGMTSPEKNCMSLEQTSLCEIGMMLTCLHLQIKSLYRLKHQILSS